ncbi:MAG: LysR family transcriptional regulator [Magnetovibrionaceae bacterium]
MRHQMPMKYVDAVAKAGSIRKAAETLSITSTALNRRILAMEEDLGVALFERVPQGVRLTAAGEIMIHHIRNQLSEMERVKSQIADLIGERRGHVSIACSQALLPFFLPEQISRYRREHKAVTFDVFVRDRAAAEQALIDRSADLALVFEPVRMAEFHTLLTILQPVHVIMPAGHPLAGLEKVRLRDCLQFPLALPTAPYGVRHLLELAVRRTSLELKAAIQSDSFEFLRNYTHDDEMLAFQLPIGLPPEEEGAEMVHRPLDERDVAPGYLYFGQLQNRILPVAAARFAMQMQETFVSRFECE